MNIKAISTNIVTGEKRVHGPYNNISIAVDSCKKIFDQAVAFNILFDQETCREILMMSPETGSDTALKRSKLLRDYR